MNKGLFSLFILLLQIIIPFVTDAQDLDPAAVKAMITLYKADPRGPYKDIRWFCKDGTVREARDPCPGENQGNQHASFKPEVLALAENHHIFLGQILATTENEDFWDERNAQSRLKQYQLERYLRNADNGWVNQKAQFYRGAMQDEDETKWGIDFYKWLLGDADNLESHFFLIRQSAKDIPHASEDNNIQMVRTVSEEIAESMSSFHELRVKIHGAPDAGDITRVSEFKEKNKDRISATNSSRFDQLLVGLKKMFRPFRVSDFSGYMKKLPADNEGTKSMEYFLNRYITMDCPPEQCRLISQTALALRQNITKPMSSTARLAMLDISNKLESLLNQEFTRWKIEYLSELMEQVYCLSEASTAFGFLELWEWDEIKREMQEPVV